MPPILTIPNAKVGVGSAARFRSVLLLHLSDLFRMRYQENKTVRDVLVWLKEQQVSIARRNFHVFINRVLRAMPLAVAKANGVDTGLLRAIRVRYKIPADPKGVRVVTAKKPVRHDSRRRRRPLLADAKPKPPRQPVARPPRQERFQADQIPLPSIVAAPHDPTQPKMKGTLEKPEGYGDWKIVHEIARRKVGKLNRSVFFIKGTVFNNRTKEDYVAEDLVRLFDLTPIEAQACFMTFTK